MLPAGSPLSAWLTWLETLHPADIELGLDRVRQVFDRLDIEVPDSVLLIAGTNGKGSSVAMAGALLRAAGLRVGSYTSPHIVDYNERIAIGADPAGADPAGADPVGADLVGADPVRDPDPDHDRDRDRDPDPDQPLNPVRDRDLIAAFETIEAVRDDVPLTYFEYGTLAAFVVFAAAGLDVWILEVGMGGRLDATNVIEPAGVLITNVALDHCDWLGEDVESIAAEKAGVMRPGVPVVFGADDVPVAIVEHAATIGARLLLYGRDFSAEAVPQPGLTGEFQKRNAAAVIALLDAAGLSAATDEDLVAAVLPAVQLVGRGQRIEYEGVEWLLDVAHNPAAAVELGRTLENVPHGGRTVAVIAALDDKDVEGIVAPLDPHVDLWIAVAADSHRALPAGELARRIANACNRPCLIAESFAHAFDEARREAEPGDRLLVTGSFYVVGPALQQLGLYSRPQP